MELIIGFIIGTIIGFIIGTIIGIFIVCALIIGREK